MKIGVIGIKCWKMCSRSIPRSQDLCRDICAKNENSIHLSMFDGNETTKRLEIFLFLRKSDTEKNAALLMSHSRGNVQNT